MPMKRHKAEEIVAKLRQVDVLVSQGQNIADAIRQNGMTEVTYLSLASGVRRANSDQVKRLQAARTGSVCASLCR